MTRRLGRSEIRELLEDYGVRPTSSLGQNFVADPNTIERIARLAGVGPGDKVLEIGAGLGSLTLALAETGASVTAMEIDRRLVEALRSILPAAVRVVAGDALRADWSELLGDGALPAGGAGQPGGEEAAGAGRGWVLVANLPYNVAATLVVDLLEHVPAVSRMLVMVQREVGERLAARPGGREYGAVTVRVAYFATARVVGRVSAEVFHPRPKVESVLVEIERRGRPAVEESVVSYGEMLALVRAGFSGRRKMLRRSLAGMVDEAAFACAGIVSTARAEELSVEQWGMLAGCQRTAGQETDPSAAGPSGAERGAAGPSGPRRGEPPTSGSKQSGPAPSRRG
ncbi:MAG TPA: 16S rRNA (adenine(1518)-N(6)/adenine(1519)-N(6))-dimethyltransferase RsmA [Acidimicrobiales bacterium]|nr:16S rRNA (adenine(1518)-N(6)/adenine(1519)-N(6))-dimethyltransferase RsmA [Acidimicrobiales bacterium]